MRCIWPGKRNGYRHLPALAEKIKGFQFRDLRANAGTDKEESGGISAAQDQLGRVTPTMTTHYVRQQRGK
ncbi:hypothetical protein [Glaciimonas immobilis]|uniref:Integrase n=1 Tax=Glaciimonas immobilis TaxID=728004 RepID=A0A840RU59_9BURK|nr:hypothetical protein [Glaciimonas immobilis]KAF3999935.1 hypothetical protein HAV38_01805 [Glaciimonas immobilis]MBB5200436.1 integrase [Glaciimonas immobilis]